MFNYLKATKDLKIASVATKSMAGSRVKNRTGIIKGLHRKLGIDGKIEDGRVSSSVERLFKDDGILSGLEKAAKTLRTSAHEVKVGILRAMLSQVDIYGFLNPNYDYVDWCSGRSELAYTLAHLIGARVVRVDKRFPNKNIIKEIFPCTQQYNVPAVKFDLTGREDWQHITVLENPKRKVAYIGAHCCGSLPDLIVYYAELQKKKPDFVALLPCHHEKMDFELSTLATRIDIDDKWFRILTRAAADLKNPNGYHEAARKSMEIINYYRAENLRNLGYKADIVRLFHPNFSHYNYLIVGVRR